MLSSNKTKGSQLQECYQLYVKVFKNQKPIVKEYLNTINRK